MTGRRMRVLVTHPIIEGSLDVPGEPCEVTVRWITSLILGTMGP